MEKEEVKTKEEAFRQAHRYLSNARETLKKSPVQYGIYLDSKFVREGSGMAYLAALRAIDGYFLGKGMPEGQLPASIEGYYSLLRRVPHNGKLKAALTVVYQNLHLFGYYRGGIDVEMIKAGIRRAEEIIHVLSRE